MGSYICIFAPLSSLHLGQLPLPRPLDTGQMVSLTNSLFFSFSKSFFTLMPVMRFSKSVFLNNSWVNPRWLKMPLFLKVWNEQSSMGQEKLLRQSSFRQLSWTWICKRKFNITVNFRKPDFLGVRFQTKILAQEFFVMKKTGTDRFQDWCKNWSLTPRINVLFC